ncbi:PCI domain-domain-containing protein [Kockovaella imperatae]|uniref:PCI domain-domain-containing protein n=1 Tax=Kockovaella imperatae TaxID=4999 RepID=A0A1Y1UQ94_9TREE|nr:PCI domain-domain-containing protein [Kockovaella imperatae]ORX40142.1 PCI domain-domain-containing protein [Kockovaella imperatae]
MSLNAQRKQEKDYTEDVKSLVPIAEDLAKSGKLQDAIDQITALEKQTRNAADMSSTATLLVLIARLSYQAGSLDTLNTQLTVMSKKHGQLKEAVVRMVDEAMKWLPELKAKKDAGEYKAGKDRWLELLDTLRDITEGKIYLELARARLTAMLASYHEFLAASAPEASSSKTPSSSTSYDLPSKGDAKADPVTKRDHLDRAADLMSDIQVETYSSMDKGEKTNFILEQMRLESLRGNWVRVRVGSRKVNRVFLKEPDSADLKLRYFDLLVELALQDEAYLEACNAYQEVWDTEEVKKDEARTMNVIENIMIYVILAPYDNEQSDMLHKLYADPALQKSPVYFDLVKCFITNELMRWPGIESIYGPTLRQSPVFASGSELGRKTGIKADEDKSRDNGLSPGDHRWEELHKRVVEHNIRVISKYYTKITMSRLTELLDLPPISAERTLCKLVTDKTIYARIDRPKGIVSFKPRQSVNATLNSWSEDVGKVLNLVEKTSHLVSKEYAMHEASQGKKVAAK